MDTKKNVSIRLSTQTIDAVELIAERVHLSPRTMLRQWVLQRLESEQHSDEVI